MFQQGFMNLWVQTKGMIYKSESTEWELLGAVE